jgi:hypothetical protein
MRVEVNEPDLVGELLEFLQRRVACVAAQVSKREIEVSLLESFRLDAHRLELDRMLKAWEAMHPHARATIRS